MTITILGPDKAKTSLELPGLQLESLWMRVLARMIPYKFPKDASEIVIKVGAVKPTIQ